MNAAPPAAVLLGHILNVAFGKTSGKKYVRLAGSWH